MSTPILSLVGSSNSGKTTLMEKLVSGLTAKGLRIATIKHSHHQPEMDTPGKDSWRHKQAGASTSLLVGPKKMLMVSDVDETLNPQLLTARLFGDYDLVLVEGYASVPGAKIEVLRAKRSNTLRCKESELIAVATDIADLKVSVPLLDMNDTQSLINFILQWLGDVE
ncbi:MAG: molybdopterin-guanine dinucleotide biosynthesis protein B [Mariprofundaceae bacterium]|nr:molybdopterin-guanine dinucleotide biosynthesis protein B [Mariprofundaceae bacterium]